MLSGILERIRASRGGIYGDRAASDSSQRYALLGKGKAVERVRGSSKHEARALSVSSR